METTASRSGALIPDPEGIGGSPALEEFKVPKVLVGCWQLLERNGDEKSALDTLEAYIKAGFVAFDTADIYGPSEDILGRLRRRVTIKGGDPGALRVFTKYVPFFDASLETAASTNEYSRKSLGVDCLDTVQYCWYGPFLDRQHVEAAGHLKQLQQEGKIRHLAACNYDTAHLKELVDAGIPIEANQVQFSLLDLRADNGLLEYCTAKGIQLLCFGTVAGGWLSDKYLGAPAPPPFLPIELIEGTVSKKLYYDSLMSWASALGNWEMFQQLLRTLRQVADRHSTTIALVAMAWVQRRLDDTCGGGIIVGVRDTSHLEELKDLRILRLDDEDMRTIRSALALGSKPGGDIWDRERLPGPLIYPWTQPRNLPLVAAAFLPTVIRNVIARSESQ